MNNVNFIQPESKHRKYSWEIESQNIKKLTSTLWNPIQFTSRTKSDNLPYRVLKLNGVFAADRRDEPTAQIPL